MSTYAIINGTGIQLIPSAEIPTTPYSVEVTQVAQAQTLTSAAFTASSALGPGNLTIAIGAISASITVASDETVETLIQAINASALSQHAIAYLLPGVDGSHIVLSSLATGAANTFEITADATLNAELAQASWTVTFQAQDATLTVNGVQIDSPSNMIKDVIPNYTLVINQLAVGVTQTIQI